MGSARRPDEWESRLPLAQPFEYNRMRTQLPALIDYNQKVERSAEWNWSAEFELGQVEFGLARIACAT